MSKISLTDYFPTVLLIDEARIDVRVRRLSNREFDCYARELDEHGVRRGVTDDATAEARAARDVREEQDRAWIRQALAANLTILPGQILHNNQELVDAGALLDLYGGRLDVVPQALSLIWGENHLSEAKKKDFRQLLDSTLGCIPTPPTVALGSAPARAATDAAPRACAEPEAATDVPLSDSSGTTDPTHANAKEALAFA
jgi:hypothetical protein